MHPCIIYCINADVRTFQWFYFLICCSRGRLKGHIFPQVGTLNPHSGYCLSRGTQDVQLPASALMTAALRRDWKDLVSLSSQLNCETTILTGSSLFKGTCRRSASPAVCPATNKNTWDNKGGKIFFKKSSEDVLLAALPLALQHNCSVIFLAYFSTWATRF